MNNNLDLTEKNESSKEDPIEIEKIRHSAAHILAQAVKNLFPDVKLGIGPATEKGFYYDFELKKFEKKLPDKNILKKIENEIQNIIDEEIPFSQITVPKEEAINMLHQEGQIYKTELLQQVSDEKVSFFNTGDQFMDLCRGPHVKHTGQIGAVKLKSSKYVYWKGDNSRPKLIRISGVAFKSNKELQEYLQKQKELKENDHRKISETLNLFINDDFQNSNNQTILEHGKFLKSIIEINFIDEFKQKNYQIVEFKNIWDKIAFTKNQYAGFLKKDDFLEINDNLIITNNQLLSAINLYEKFLNKNINLKIENNTKGMKFCYQNKKFQFQMMDSHTKSGLFNSSLIDQINTIEIFPKNEYKQQIRETIQIPLIFFRKYLDQNISAVLTGKNKTLVSEVQEILVELNVNIHKYKSEKDFELNLIYTDALDRDWKLSNFEINSILNSEINSNLINKKQNTKKDEFLILHTNIIDNLELIIALLTEKYNGKFPLQIAPFQAVIIPHTDKYNQYAKTIFKKLKKNNLRIYTDLNEIAYNKKLQNAEILKIPYILTVGEQEEKNNVLSVKPSHGEELGLMKIEEFLHKLDL